MNTNDLNVGDVFSHASSVKDSFYFWIVYEPGKCVALCGLVPELTIFNGSITAVISHDSDCTLVEPDALLRIVGRNMPEWAINIVGPIFEEEYV